MVKSVSSESWMWDRLKSDVGPLYASRIEPRYPPGIPDVMFVGPGVSAGWIELKFDVNVVRPEQAIFLRGWCGHGGNAFVLAYWDQRCHLVRGEHVGIDRKIDFSRAHAVWDDGCPTLAEMIPWLR